RRPRMSTDTDLVPVEAHLADILAATRPLTPVRLGLEEAEGGVLAEDAAALCPLPSFDNAGMDGYAVHAADVAAAAPGAPVTLPVTDEIPAGDTRTLTVAPRPRVEVIATGNELIDPGTPLTPGQIWESNGYMLAALARQAGGRARRHRVKDDPVAVVTALEELSASADLLVTTGGVSMGG